MCGIIGAAGLIGVKEEKVIKDLLIIDSLRGVDSTGIATIPRANGEVHVAKSLGNAFDLIDSPHYNRAMSGVHRAIIGHNRFGTIGKATKTNAHPFEYDTLVGVHNGTVTSKWKMVDGKDFDTDSAAIYNHIDQKGLRDVMGLMEGAWTLVWWDKFKEEINFLRNNQRPLYMTYSEDNNVLFWASEPWMLEGALWRNDIKHKEITALPIDMHMSVAITNKGELEKPRLVDMPARVPETKIYTSHGNFNHNNKHLPKPTLTVVPKETEEKKKGVVPQAAKSFETLTLTSSNSLANSKTVSLEVLSHCENDGWGASYLTCHDENHRFANIRWYYNCRHVKPDDYIGEFILADIGVRIDRGQDKSYYKVVDSSVVALFDESDVVEKTDTWPDSRGKLLSETEWINKHGECGWCSNLIRPTDRHAFGAAYQCFCSDCMEVDEVKEYARFTTLVN